MTTRLRYAVSSAALGIATVLGGAAFADEIGDAAAGKALFEECSGCHQVGEGVDWSRLG